MLKFTILPFFLVTTLFLCTKSFSDQNDGVPSFSSPLVVKRDQRTQIVATEFGEISAVQIGDGYHIQFITLEPNSFLLPLLLHSDMVLFVHTGTYNINSKLNYLFLFNLKLLILYSKNHFDTARTEPKYS